MSRLILSIALLVWALPSLATDYFLEADGSGDLPTIQAAIDVSGGGDTIWLAPGTYSGSGNRDLYLYQDVSIKATNPAEPTVISCGGSLLFPHKAFTIETCSPTFYGLTIQGGYGTDGGAVTLIEAHPTFSYCVLKDNDASGDGGAVYIGADSYVVFERTVFDHNTAGSDGGALYATSWAEVVVDQCTFFRNKAPKGSSIHLVEEAACTIDRSILTFGLEGRACTDYYGGPYSVTCTNVAMNQGGDWVFSIAGMDGVDGNISADPRLCDPMAAAPLYGASMNSPSAIAACGFQGAVAPDFTWENPVYGVLTDDQGMFPNIQAAIDGVVPGGVIGLEDDTYTGAGNRDLIGQGNLFTIAARGTNPAACVLDCQGTPGDPHRVIRFLNDDPAGTVIRGVTLTGGNMPTGSGGAVLIQNGSSPRFENCIFRDNTVGADGGGAMAIFGTSGNYSHTEIEDCLFENNSSAGDGGAIRAEYWRHLIRASDFSGNQAGQNGGDIFTENFLAGGMTNCTFLNGESVDGHSVYMKDGLDPSIIWFCDFTTPISTGKGSLYVVNPDSLLLHGCEFTGNHGESGGGIYATATTAGHYLEIDDCLFVENEVYGGGSGGAVYADSMLVKVVDSEFSLSFASEGAALSTLYCQVEISGSNFNDGWAFNGGAIANGMGQLTATGCTFSGNQASTIGGAVLSWSSIDSFVNCDFLDNIADSLLYGTAGAVAGGGTNLALTDCLFAGNGSSQNASVLYLYNESVGRMEGCTLFENSNLEEDTQFSYSQILVQVFTELELIECLITNGWETIPVDGGGVLSVYNCDVHGNSLHGRASNYDGLLAGHFGINGNISEYPLYCDAGSRDLTLNEASICLSVNNPHSANIGARGVGCYGVTPVEGRTPAAPLVLEGNHPNPFNPRTVIRFTLGSPGVVRLEIYDVGGRLVRTLIDGNVMAAGPHGAAWDGMNSLGSPAPSGIYYYRVESGGKTGTGKMALLK